MKVRAASEVAAAAIGVHAAGYEVRGAGSYARVHARRVPSQLLRLACAGAICALAAMTAGAGAARAAWTPTQLTYGGSGDSADYLIAASCPSTSLCVALDSFGDGVISASPVGSAATWKLTNINTLGGYNTMDVYVTTDAVSCASASLCVAVDSAGDVTASTNPTGGAAAWSATNVDGTNDLSAVSCTSTPSLLCVAVDGAGDVVTSTNPAGGAGAWTSPTWTAATR